MKTHKGSQKRFKKTGSGKVLRRASGKRHLMSGKATRRARRLRGWRALSDRDRRCLERQHGPL